MKVFVFRRKPVDLGSLLTNDSLQSTQFVPHFIAYSPVLVFTANTALILGKDPGGGKLLKFRTPVTPGTNEPVRWIFIPWHSAVGLILGFEYFPVHLGEFPEKFFQLLVTTGHSANLIDHRGADIFGSGFAVLFEGQRKTPARPL